MSVEDMPAMSSKRTLSACRIYTLALGGDKNAASRSDGGEAAINATSKDAMKLRMTGFECSPSFVIRLGSEEPPQ